MNTIKAVLKMCKCFMFKTKYLLREKWRYRVKLYSREQTHSDVFFFNANNLKISKTTCIENNKKNFNK